MHDEMTEVTPTGSSTTKHTGKDARSSRTLSNANRMRNYRRRKRDRLRYIGVEIREKEVDALITMGFLAMENRKDNLAVTRALHRYLDRTLSKVTS